MLKRALLAVFFCSFAFSADDPGTKKKVRLVLSEGDFAEKQQQRNSLSSLGISENDIEHLIERDPPPPPPPTPGDEYIPEKPISSLHADVESLYQQALRFLERGKGHGIEGRKAAYRLLQQASEQGHPDAMKLMGFAHMFGDRARWSLVEAHRIFEDLAVEGSPDANLGLAFMHSSGLGVGEPNQAKALVYYTFAALGGNPLAMMALGYRYHQGVGVAPSCELSLSFYEQVAALVASKATLAASNWVAKMRLIEADEPGWSSSSHVVDHDVLEYYRFLAEKGDTSAQVHLGQVFLHGNRGVEQNFELAVDYFSKAADVGHASAYAYLGKMYLHGTPFTPQDNTTAFHFFLKSAEKGHLSGQSGLGIMYLQGRGVKRDYGKAYRLFAMSAEQGGTEGQLYLGEMYFKGLGVKRDFKQALKYYQMASQTGHILAYFNLGLMHATGVGVPRSCETAVQFFKAVSEHGRWGERIFEAYFAYKEGRVDEAAIKYLFMGELGYEQAQSNIAYILDKGTASTLFPAPRDEVLGRALVMWQRSANQEHAMSRIKLGDYHYYGWGTPRNYDVAAQHYKIAYERHLSAQAMFNLGYMHENGYGLTKDLHLAKRFYDMAAEHSTDAVVPVTLALVKLAGLYLLEEINQHPVVKYLELTFGAQWDIMVMTAIFATVLIIVLKKFLGRTDNVLFVQRD